MRWGVEMARKGGVPADRVLNAMPLAKLLRYFSQKRRALGNAAMITTGIDAEKATGATLWILPLDSTFCAGQS
jgi:hypothetical protein